MFGISGGEFIFIIFIVLMFFGSDKIPELARALGKGMAQLKNATNDIKSEIHKNVNESGLDPNSLTGGISDEIAKAKEGFSKMVTDADPGIKNELDQVRENFAKMSQPDATPVEPAAIDPIEDIAEGPIKRQN